MGFRRAAGQRAHGVHPDLQQVPVARKLPSIAVTPLPANAQSDESATSDTDADDSAAEADE